MAKHHKSFKGDLDTIEFNAGSFGTNQGPISKAVEDMADGQTEHTKAQCEATEKAARDSAVAIAFIQGANENRCGKLKDDLENTFAQGDNK